MSTAQSSSSSPRVQSSEPSHRKRAGTRDPSSRVTQTNEPSGSLVAVARLHLLAVCIFDARGDAAREPVTLRALFEVLARDQLALGQLLDHARTQLFYSAFRGF